MRCGEEVKGLTSLWFRIVVFEEDYSRTRNIFGGETDVLVLNDLVPVP